MQMHHTTHRSYSISNIQQRPDTENIFSAHRSDTQSQITHRLRQRRGRTASTELPRHHRHERPDRRSRDLSDPRARLGDFSRVRAGFRARTRPTDTSQHSSLLSSSVQRTTPRGRGAISDTHDSLRPACDQCNAQSGGSCRLSAPPSERMPCYFYYNFTAQTVRPDFVARTSSPAPKHTPTREFDRRRHATNDKTRPDASRAMTSMSNVPIVHHPLVTNTGIQSVCMRSVPVRP